MQVAVEDLDLGGRGDEVRGDLAGAFTAEEDLDRLSLLAERSTSSLRLRMMSVTSSFTPSIELNSWSTPSMRTLDTAAPGIEDSSVRRRLLPSV